ncbi:hypothetical protein KSC_027560 [Ktedonobacter sp. SOSP1-52]|uniref:hypothetical protein n=1 Tax=Ktedonobacter sp. SOSP1-52 TaxID=2778366 RepID=UPI001915CC72|nr:hypothetical protein [Ktedonobacter sp. SOSP1-52]GHO63864.1 hypothetical protein KSC_027560 [Ktedonobacter sp. SOSP1-52]
MGKTYLRAAWTEAVAALIYNRIHGPELDRTWTDWQLPLHPDSASKYRYLAIDLLNVLRETPDADKTVVFASIKQQPDMDGDIVQQLERGNHLEVIRRFVQDPEHSDEEEYKILTSLG